MRGIQQNQPVAGTRPGIGRNQSGQKPQTRSREVNFLRPLMNEDEIKPEESAEQPVDLNERCAELSRQNGMMRVGLLVLTATFATFLAVQNWRLSNDLQLVRGQMAQ